MARKSANRQAGDLAARQDVSFELKRPATTAIAANTQAAPRKLPDPAVTAAVERAVASSAANQRRQSALKPRSAPESPAAKVAHGPPLKAPAPAPSSSPPAAPALAPYEAACRALAEARSICEVKEIHDQSIGMAAWAHRAKNFQAEADAVALRMQAARRLGEMIDSQKNTVGLNVGTRGQLAGGLTKNPPDIRPTLASQNIDKNLAHQARVLAALSQEKFEERVAEARGAAGRVMRRVVNAVAIEQEREAYRARTYQGGTVADLEAFLAGREC